MSVMFLIVLDTQEFIMHLFIKVCVQSEKQVSIKKQKEVTSAVWS